MPYRRLRATLPLSAIVVLVACGDSTPLPHFELHDTLAAGQTLSLRNVRGNITVEPSTNGQFAVIAQGVSEGSRPERVHVVSNAVSDGVAVCAIWGRDNRCESGDFSPSSGGFWNKFGFRSGVDVNFTVKVPAGVKLDIRDINGNVKVMGATTDVLVHAVNGWITARTDGGALELKTVNGSVTGEIASVPSRLLAESINGRVDVTGPADLAGDVEMSAVNGGVSSEFAITTTGNLNRRRLAGHIGTGGGLLKLKSVNGGVALHKRA
jgi:hypothetical protein